jgi:predicted nuclease of predicted toxin-antitoxin system
VKLLLDEMYPRAIADQLRDRGHDVISVHDAPGRGSPDPDVLEHARMEGRTVVTENVRDFRPLAERQIEAGKSHPGLVFTTDRRWPRTDIGALINALDRLLAEHPDQPVAVEIWL